MNDLELFYLLQDLLKDEEKSVDAFHTRDAEIKEVLELRDQQIQNPLLKFSIFDPLRNESARKLRLQRVRILWCFLLKRLFLKALFSRAVRADEDTRIAGKATAS